MQTGMGKAQTGRVSHAHQRRIVCRLPPRQFGAGCCWLPHACRPVGALPNSGAASHQAPQLDACPSSARCATASAAHRSAVGCTKQPCCTRHAAAAVQRTAAATCSICSAAWPVDCCCPHGSASTAADAAARQRAARCTGCCCRAPCRGGWCCQKYGGCCCTSVRLIERCHLVPITHQHTHTHTHNLQHITTNCTFSAPLFSNKHAHTFVL